MLDLIEQHGHLLNLIDHDGAYAARQRANLATEGRGVRLVAPPVGGFLQVHDMRTLARQEVPEQRGLARLPCTKHQPDPVARQTARQGAFEVATIEHAAVDTPGESTCLCGNVIRHPDLHDWQRPPCAWPALKAERAEQ
jgi:hypothetical protein